MAGKNEWVIVDLDQFDRLLWWVFWTGWFLLVLIILDDFLGLWNEVGAVGATVLLLIAGLFGFVVSRLLSTESQPQSVREGVTDNGRRLGRIHDGVRGNGCKLGEIHEDVRTLHQDNERQTEILIDIRDRL